MQARLHACLSGLWTVVQGGLDLVCVCPNGLGCRHGVARLCCLVLVRASCAVEDESFRVKSSSTGLSLSLKILCCLLSPDAGRSSRRFALRSANACSCGCQSSFLPVLVSITFALCSADNWNACWLFWTARSSQHYVYGPSAALQVGGP